jgi:hypothetical protein
MRNEWKRLSLLLAFAALPVLSACAEPGEDEAEPAIDPEPTVMTEEGVAEVRYFTDWDTDDDTYLTVEEFATGWEDVTLWEDWDTDADTYLTEDEFGTAFVDYDWYDEGLYAEWDVDSDDLLTEEEFTTGLYAAWDVDDDDLLTESEFEVEVLD